MTLWKLPHISYFFTKNSFSSGRRLLKIRRKVCRCDLLIVLPVNKCRTSLRSSKSKFAVNRLFENMADSKPCCEACATCRHLALEPKLPLMPLKKLNDIPSAFVICSDLNPSNLEAKAVDPNNPIIVVG